MRDTNGDGVLPRVPIPKVGSVTPVAVGPAPTPIKKHVQDVLLRAGLTFLEGFAAAWALTGNRLDRAAITGAIAAGLSVAINVTIKAYKTKQEG